MGRFLLQLNFTSGGLIVMSISPRVSNNRQTPTDTGLRRKLGLWDLTMTGIGGVVGSGWIYAALTSAQIAGPGAILSWLIGGVAVAIIGLCFAELAGIIPETGGVIRYPHYSHGSLVSFLLGWAALISWVGTPPIEAEAVLQYASSYIPHVYNVANSTLTSRGLLLAVALMVVFSVINYLGVKLYARINNPITFLKLVIPLGTAILLLALNFHPANLTHFGGFLPYHWAGVFSAISTGGVIFTFTGFRGIFDLAGEAKNPQRDMPRAFLIAMGFSFILYVLLQLALVGAIPGKDLVHGWASVALSSPFADLALSINLGWLAIILYADAIISPGGTGLVYASSTPRALYAFAQNGYFPKGLKKISRFGTPVIGIIVTLLVGVAFLLPFPSWQKMVGIISSATIITYMMGPVSAAALRLSAPGARRPYRLWALNVLAPIGFVVGSMIFYWTGWPTDGYMIILVAVGFVVYVLYRRKEARDRWIDMRNGIWLLVYFLFVVAFSYIGSFGGIGLVKNPWDSVVVAIVSIGFYYWGRASGKPSVSIPTHTVPADESTSAPGVTS